MRLKVLKAGFIGLVSMLFLTVNAQENTTYKPFELNLQVKTMHLWRGYRVTDAAMSDADLHFITKDKSFKAGFWGGYGFNGNYKEFDYYVSYEKNGWAFAIWDINNFSNYPDADIFNYDKAKTSHFVDLSASYTLQNSSFPLKIYWSTIVLGRDTYTNDNGKLKNAFSNYVELSSPVWKTDKEKLSLGVGGGFSFLDDKNFYGEKPNVTNIFIQYNRDLKVFEYTLPVSALVMWNPEQKYGGIQFAANLF